MSSVRESVIRVAGGCCQPPPFTDLSFRPSPASSSPLLLALPLPSGQLGWDSTTITSAVAHHTLVQATVPVSLPQWDGTVAWFVENYAGGCCIPHARRFDCIP